MLSEKTQLKSESKLDRSTCVRWLDRLEMNAGEIDLSSLLLKIVLLTKRRWGNDVVAKKKIIQSFVANIFSLHRPFSEDDQNTWIVCQFFE
jgi:hypothetical protein